MLASLNEVLAIAEEGNYAIGAFNTPNLECMMAVIRTAEKYNVPIIISHAQLHEPVAPLAVIGPIMVLMAQKAAVPVCVHLDHGETLDYLEKALEIGFTSIMYDGSTLPYEENVKNTVKAAAMAKRFGAGIEAEIGTLSRAEAGVTTAGGTKEEKKEIYTDPDLAKKFADATGIDALAASFGTAHGIYTTKPKLDFPRIERIKELVKLPLVMHGGSGVSPQDYTKAISKGIRKINYYSYMSREGVFAAKKLLAEKEVTFYHDIADAAVNAMAADVEKAMRVFYNIK